MAKDLSELTRLLVYRNLLQDELVQKLAHYAQTETAELGFEIAGELITKAETIGLAGNLSVSYIIYLIASGQNVFSSTAEKTGGKISESLLKAVIHDIVIMKNILNGGLRCAAAGDLIDNYVPAHPLCHDGFTALQDYFLDVTQTYTPEQVAVMLCQHYARYGYGVMAGCRAFKWDVHKGLVGIQHSDRVQLDDIVGYERQKQVLIANTEAFIAGRPANNVLLVGARGTGKSTSVKALANHYYDAGLRLVEVSKKDFECLPAIMNTLRQWGKKFILFLDDLSFEDFELGYKNLKSVMDGGVEAKPDNVVIYATSNRRHLVRESWHDRAGDEIHHQDTINEKISLADRFGITLAYAAPNQNEYLNIVENIAKKNNISLTPAELRAQALRWEMAHSGRSGRLARQFIASLAGNCASS